MLQENIHIIKKIYKRKLHILVLTVLAMAAGYLFSYLSKPSFKSTAYVYPANLGLYSQESQTEQMLQFLNSNEIRLYMLRKFNLAAHYKIDTLKKTYLFSYDEVYDKKISINKTKYESIELKVEDIDPDTARLLVSGILEAVDWLIEKEHREKYKEDVKNSKIYLDYKTREVDSAQSILNTLSEKYGVLDMRIQLKEAARSYYKDMKADGKGSPLADLLTNLGKHGVEYIKMSNYFEEQVRGYAWAQNDYQKKLSELQRKNSFIVMASKPNRPVVANWPKKSIVTLICGFAAFITCCLYFIFIDRIKEVYVQVSSEK